MRHHKCECDAVCQHHVGKRCRRRAVLTPDGLRCRTCRRLAREDEQDTNEGNGEGRDRYPRFGGA